MLPKQRGRPCEWVWPQPGQRWLKKKTPHKQSVYRTICLSDGGCSPTRLGLELNHQPKHLNKVALIHARLPADTRASRVPSCLTPSDGLSQGKTNRDGSPRQLFAGNMIWCRRRNLLYPYKRSSMCGVQTRVLAQVICVWRFCVF